MNKSKSNDSIDEKTTLPKENLQKKEQRLSMLLFFIIIFAVIPLYLISGYAHPCVDDYSYGRHTAQVWKETGSLEQVFLKAIEKTGDSYRSWQGTFSSIFLMRLQPAIFGEQYYFLTTIILLTVFIVCSILFYMAFFSKLFHASFFQGLIISILLSLGAVEFTYVISDSFYWYNGGITYTFFYSMEAFLFALLIFFYCAKKRWIKIILGIVSIILAFFLCGGNYVTALITVEILFFACILLFLYNWERKKKNNLWKESNNKNYFINKLFFIMILLAGLVGFFIAILAPGNALRQESVGKASNPFLAIGLSFAYGIYSIANCWKLPVLVLFLCCIPCFALISKKSKFSFHYPAIVTLLSYCLYSSQITPVIYAQGLKIPYRIMNIIYFSCFVMTGINLFYWVGYFIKRQLWKTIIEKALVFYQKYFLHYYLFCFLLLCFTVVGNISIEAEVDTGGSTQVSVTRMPASVSACFYLLNGEAKQYDKEAWERYFIYSDHFKEDIVVKEFSVKPEIIFHSDITEDPKNWKNSCVKRYFGKKSVKLEKSK